MTEEAIINTIEFLKDNYGQEPKDGQISFWLEALADYDDATLTAAAVAWVKQSKWYPKLSEFLGMCEDYEREQNNVGAWARAMELYNANLRGEITDSQLERDSAWRWYEKRNRPVEIDDAIWAKSCTEVSQWMVEDVP